MRGWNSWEFDIQSLSHINCPNPLRSTSTKNSHLVRQYTHNRSGFVSSEVKNKYTIRQAMCVQRNIEARLFHQCCRGKAVCIKYSGCVFVVLDISMYITRPLLYCHLWHVWLYIFPYYLINGTIFGEKVAEYKLWFWFSMDFSFSEKILIPRKIPRHITYVHGSSRKVAFLVVRLERNLKFLGRFSKNTQTNFTKIHPVVTVLFHADVQADMTKLSRFSQFGECV